MWEIYFAFIFLMGISHAYRDARLYQYRESTLVYQLAQRYKTFGWYFASSSNQSIRPDWAHGWDTFMRWSSAGYGVATGAITTIYLHQKWYWGVLLWIAGLYAAEWLFTLHYHYINPDPGDPDHMPFWRLLKRLILPFVSR